MTEILLLITELDPRRSLELARVNDRFAGVPAYRISLLAGELQKIMQLVDKALSIRSISIFRICDTL